MADGIHTADREFSDSLRGQLYTAPGRNTVVLLPINGRSTDLPAFPSSIAAADLYGNPPALPGSFSRGVLYLSAPGLTLDQVSALLEGRPADLTAPAPETLSKARIRAAEGQCARRGRGGGQCRGGGR